MHSRECLFFIFDGVTLQTSVKWNDKRKEESHFFYLAVSYMYMHDTALLVVSSQGRFKNYKRTDFMVYSK